MTQTQEMIKNMFAAGAHFAYSRSRRHPSVQKYIFGTKNRVEIFDLEKTSELLENAQNFMRELGKGRKTVLYCGGKNEARNAVREHAQSIGMPFVAGRWIGGTLTNFNQIRSRVDRMEDLMSKREKGELHMYTKRERLEIDREIEELEKMFGGLRGLTRKPDAMLIVDTRHEVSAIKEARAMRVPVVGILNSDCNISDVEYPVIGNDATVSSVTYFMQTLTDAYKEGLNTAVKTESEDDGAESAE